MKQLKKIWIICLLATVAAACSKEDPVSLNLLTTQIKVEAAGGEQEIAFLTNQSWSVRCNADWVADTIPFADLFSNLTSVLTKEDVHDLFTFPQF